MLIFTDPSSAKRFGYVDEWVGDDVFLYTGAGQIGDQRMTSGNRKILNHLTDGRALRVFEGARGVVRYIGQFIVDPENPFATVTARQRDSDDLRQVIQFRLLRLAEEAKPQLQGQLPTGTAYRSADELGAFETPSGRGSQNPDAYGRGARSHRRLQNGLAAAVTAAGKTPWSPAPHDPDFDEAWSYEADHIIVAEVKSLTRTNEVRQLRMGLGQVLDYQDTLSTRFGRVTPVLYVQHTPTDPRWTGIAVRCGVVLAWPGRHAGIPGVENALSEPAESLSNASA